MSIDTNKQTAQKFFSSVDSGDASASEALLTADFVAHVAGDERAVTGQKGTRARRATSIALSEREIEVLGLVSREHTIAAIAEALGISPKTVERHVTHIYDKLGVATRAGLALYALEHGLL